MPSYILLFLFSALLLAASGKWTVDALTRVAHFSRWREFVVAFFTVSLGAVAPEFFVGVASALRGVPELSLGNIIGQNIMLLTFTVAISVFALGGAMAVESKTVRMSAVFASIAAIFPLVLALDGNISRIDGLVLILIFVLFIFWLFSKKDRFIKIYEIPEKPILEHGWLSILKNRLSILKNFAAALAGLALIVLSAEGLIRSAMAFSDNFGFTASFVGILIVAAGTGFPETYFSVTLARKGYSWMILGGLMGSVAISSTMVLGTVALIKPIVITDVSLLAIGRLFLIISAILFLFFVRTKSEITKKEAAVLLAVYSAFIASVIFLQ